MLDLLLHGTLSGIVATVEARPMKLAADRRHTMSSTDKASRTPLLVPCFPHLLANTGPRRKGCRVAKNERPLNSLHISFQDPAATSSTM